MASPSDPTVNPRRIRILTWMDPLNPRAGGDVRYLAEVSIRLVRDGHQVVWIASRFEGAPTEDDYGGVRIIRTGNIYTVYLAHHFNRRIRNLPDADITLETLSSVPFFLKKRGTRSDALILQHVVPFSQMLRKTGPLAPIPFVLDRVVAPWLYRERRALVPSQATASDVRALGYRHVIIFRLGNDTSAVDMAKKELLIVAPGPVKPWKHHDDIVEAFSRVDRSWKLAVFGAYETGRLEYRLKDIVRSHHLENQVNLMGHVSGAVKLDLLSRASLCAIASEKEGWSIAAMEAQAFGCPVVAYDIPALRETVIDGQTGLLVDPHESESLSKAMGQLINDPGLRRRMAETAIRHASRFDWESSYRDLLLKLELC